MSTERLNDLKEILRTELELARVRLAVAKTSFTQVVGVVPSAIPAPDGVPYIQRAGNEYMAALAFFRAAAERFSDFVAHGIVPSEFLENDGS